MAILDVHRSRLKLRGEPQVTHPNVRTLSYQGRDVWVESEVEYNEHRPKGTRLVVNTTHRILYFSINGDMVHCYVRDGMGPAIHAIFWRKLEDLPLSVLSNLFTDEEKRALQIPSPVYRVLLNVISLDIISSQRRSWRK